MYLLAFFFAQAGCVKSDHQQLVWVIRHLYWMFCHGQYDALQFFFV